LGEQELKKKFYDIVNSEDWDFDANYTPEMDDINVGQVIYPTPIPGLFITFIVDLNMDEGGFRG
jgi:hypothetical protein